MRKDVKIGLGIGGVLLAVLIVYALVPKNDTQVARNGDTNKSTEDSGTGASTASGSGGATPISTPSPAGQGTTQNPATHDSAGGTATTGDHVAAREGTTGDAGEQDTAQATSSKIDWEKILKTGLVPEDAKVPMLAHKEAEDVFGGGSEPTWDPKPAPQHTTLQAGGNPGAKGTQVAQGGGGTHAKPGADAKPQAAKGTTEHTVQQGENLSMIAAVAYGDARKYKEILKANPGLDERKIRPGTVIKLPDASTFATPAPTGPAQQAKTDAKADTKIDPKSQYKVEPDDNLSRISAKLYGSTAKAKSIYEANKDTIGADPGKLKLGTVLKLPEPPTVQQAAR